MTRSHMNRSEAKQRKNFSSVHIFSSRAVFFASVAALQCFASSKPGSRLKFKVEHFYDNHRIDSFFFYLFSFYCLFVASTYHVLQNIAFVFNRNDKLFVNFRLPNASHCLQYHFTQPTNDIINAKT